MKTATLVALVSVYCFLSLFLVVLSLFVCSVNSVSVYSGSVGLGECLKSKQMVLDLKGVCWLSVDRYQSRLAK